MEHTFNLDGEYVVNKGPRDKAWSVSVAIDRAMVPAHLIPLLIDHGLKQKIADAASAAKDAAEAEGLMAKARDAILAGDWSSRGSGGAGVDEETLVARMVIRDALKANWGAKSAKWADFTGLADDEQDYRLDTVRIDNPTIFEDAIARKLADRKAERERKAALRGAKLVINI